VRGFKGYLVADAHTVYDHLYTSGDVVEVGCWAHCRRYFFKAYPFGVVRRRRMGRARVDRVHASKSG
jgi:hypothetical protein